MGSSQRRGAGRAEGLLGQMGNVSSASVFTSTLSEREDLVFGTLYLLFGIVSLCGNSLLLLVAYCKRATLKPAEFFIVNLAVSDLSMTVTLFPLAASSFFAHRWLFSRAMCTAYAFCAVLFGLCSLTSLTVLSTVCCLKVCYPAYGNKFSPSHAGVLLLCVWVYALMFATAPLAEWGSYGPEPYGTACCIAWETSSREATLYILSLFVFCYLLPCLLILASYSLILWTVRGSRRAVRQHVSPQHRARGVQGPMVKLSVAVCLGFLAAWTPYAVVALWAVCGGSSRVPALAFVLSAAFAKSSTLYNPLVYLLFKPNFHRFLSRDAVLLRALHTLLCCGRAGTMLWPLPPPGARTRCPPAFSHPQCHRVSLRGRSPPAAPPVPLAVLLARGGPGAASVTGDALPTGAVRELL